MATYGEQRIIHPSELADELAEYLATRGVGTVAGDIFTMHMPSPPAAPLEAILIRPDGGMADPRDVVSRPHFNVQIRSARSDTGAVRAEQVYDLLHKVVVRTSSFVGRFTGDAYPGQWFRDGNGAFIHSMGFSFVGKLRHL